MTSLRRTRRFSCSPTAPGSQQLQHHEEDSYRDLPIPEVSVTSSAWNALESPRTRSETQSRNIKKAKSQLATQHSHISGDDERRNEAYRALSSSLDRNATRDVSPGCIESRGRKKRHGKGRSPSAGPRVPHGGASASSSDVQRVPVLPAQPPSFLVPKSRSRSQSRSSSPMPSHHPHSSMENSLSNMPEICQPSDIKVRPRKKSRRKGASRSRSSSSSDGVVTRKPSTASGLPVPSSRAASPLPPRALTLNISDYDSHTRAEHATRSPSPTVQASSRVQSALPSLPLSTRRETSKNKSGDTSSFPSRSRSQSRASQASSFLVSSRPSAISAPRTLKDVTRLLEENRGKLSRRHSPHASGLESATHHLDDISSQQSSAGSTSTLSGNRTLQREVDMSTLSPDVDKKKSALTERSRQTRPGYGLALMNENGDALGMPSFEQTSQISKLRPVRKVTTTHNLTSVNLFSPQNASAKRAAVSSGSDSFKRSSDRTSRTTAAHETSSSSDSVLQHGRDGVTSQDSQSSSLSRRESLLPKDRSRCRAPVPLNHNTQSNERQDWRQGQSDHDHASRASNIDTASSPSHSYFSPSLVPKSFPKPILVSRRPSTPTRSAIPSLPAPRPRIETSFGPKPNNSNTSSGSQPHPRKLATHDIGRNDRASSPTSSNPGTPKSNTAATSGDFTILALSPSQNTLGQTNENDHVVPDDAAMAAEVANEEERRRKALAGLVEDLHLENDDQDREQSARKHLKDSSSRDFQDTVLSRRESDPDYTEDDEEDDDAFFARLSMRQDEGSLLEEPEPEVNAGFKEDNADTIEEHFDSDSDAETEAGGEDENTPLPPTPKFVHPLSEGDDLESRITRVTSLNRISPTPLSCYRGQELPTQMRSRPESPTTWKPTPTTSKEKSSLRPRPADLHVSENTETARTRVGKSLADAPHAQGIGTRPESSKRRGPVDPSFTNFVQEDAVPSSGSHNSGLVADNEMALTDCERLLDAGSGVEETLSSGAEALFKQLQVEAEAREIGDIGRAKTASSDHFRSQEETLPTPREGGSNSRTTFHRLESQHSPAVNSREPLSLRTWRSTLPFGAYDSLAERHGPSEMRRQEIIWELCETEQTFVKSLRLILRLFVQPLRHEDRTWIPGVPRDVTRLFDWFDDIMHLHSQMSSALHAARSSQYPVVIQIAETLRPFVPRLELHQPYLVRLESVGSAVEAMSKDSHSDFGEFVRLQTASPECESMNLTSFLLKPVQRLMKYPLFFKQLWELTPRSHPDHLPTFSLLHSTDMIIRVMQEVKAREEEYELVKNLASRIKGLPPGYQLARRERRLVAQGLLRRIILSDKERSALDAATDARAGQRSQNTASSFTSTSSESSSFSGDWEYHPTRTANIATSGTDHSLHAESIVSDASLDSATASTSNSRSTSRSQSSLRGSLRHKSKESSVYAFVFTDLMILTTPMSERMHLLRSPRSANEGKEMWKLIDDVGVSRILGVTDQSGQLSNHGHLIAVELMSMTRHLLEADAFSSGATAIPVYLSIPDQSASSVENRYDAFAELKARWLDAFERCFRFTLRSLSFPSYAGNHGTCGGNADLESDTKSSVMSILSSGLPLPISPSQQLDEAHRGRQADLIQEEREERGWWSLRFHQVLKEVQRSSRSPVLDAAPGRRNGTPSKLQGGKRSEPRPFILSPNPSITITPSRKVGLLSLGKKKSK